MHLPSKENNIWICMGAVTGVHLCQVGLTPFAVAGVHVEPEELVPVGWLQIVAGDAPHLQARG